MVEDFFEFIQDQYEKFLDNFLYSKFGELFSYFTKMYYRLSKKNYEIYNLIDINDFINKEDRFKKTYELCKNNISDLIKSVDYLSDSKNFIDEYKEWKEEEGEELEDDFDQSDDFYSYYNKTFMILWDELREDQEYSEIFDYLKNINYRDEYELIIMLRKMIKEIVEMYSMIQDFFEFKEFNKTQLIECLFSDEEINIDSVYY